MYLSLIVIIIVGAILYTLGHVKGYNKGQLEEHQAMRQQLLERDMIDEDDTFWW